MCVCVCTCINVCTRHNTLLSQAIMKANPNSKKLYIMDARPKINAVANIVRDRLPTECQLFHCLSRPFSPTPSGHGRWLRVRRFLC